MLSSWAERFKGKHSCYYTLRQSERTTSHVQCSTTQDLATVESPHALPQLLSLHTDWSLPQHSAGDACLVPVLWAPLRVAHSQTTNLQGLGTWWALPKARCHRVPQHPRPCCISPPAEDPLASAGRKEAAPNPHCGVHLKEHLYVSQVWAEDKAVRCSNSTTFCQFSLNPLPFILLLFLLSGYPPLLFCPRFQVTCVRKARRWVGTFSVFTKTLHKRNLVHVNA